VRASNRSLAELTQPVTLYPQVLVNVRVSRGFDFNADPRVMGAVRDLEQTLSGNGRVLLRASGTEPVIRVMVEGPDKARIHALAEQLAGTVAQVAEKAA
jgi:phosphoglucosamine mutase